jgi:hypothetical protein
MTESGSRGGRIDWSTVRRHGAFPRLDEHSFLPPTLSGIHISGTKDGAGFMPGDTATHLVAAIAEMWGASLEKFWLMNYVLSVRDLGTIADRLRGLDTLMLRMSESRKDVGLSGYLHTMRLTDCWIPARSQNG